MKLKFICLVFAIFSFWQCKKAENSQLKEKILQEKNTKTNKLDLNSIKFKIVASAKKVADTLEYYPMSKIDIVINGKQYEIAKVPGEGALIEKSEFSNNNVPVTAMSACSSWWAGSGDWFYVEQKGDKAIIYQGWDGEGNEENKGKNWKIAKEIKIE